MSVFPDARAQLLLADYASTDAGGKLNVIGGSISFLGLTPEGQTPPFTVVATVEIPAKLVGKQYALSLELYNETLGAVAQMPSPNGVPQAMRVQQMAVVQPLAPMRGVKPPTDA